MSTRAQAGLGGCLRYRERVRCPRRPPCNSCPCPGGPVCACSVGKRGRSPGPIDPVPRWECLGTASGLGSCSQHRPSASSGASEPPLVTRPRKVQGPAGIWPSRALVAAGSKHSCQSSRCDTGVFHLALFPQQPLQGPGLGVPLRCSLGAAEENWALGPLQAAPGSGSSLSSSSQASWHVAPRLLPSKGLWRPSGLRQPLGYLGVSYSESSRLAAALVLCPPALASLAWLWSPCALVWGHGSLSFAPLRPGAFLLGVLQCFLADCCLRAVWVSPGAHPPGASFSCRPAWEPGDRGFREKQRVRPLWLVVNLISSFCLVGFFLSLNCLKWTYLECISTEGFPSHSSGLSSHLIHSSDPVSCS